LSSTDERKKIAWPSGCDGASAELSGKFSLRAALPSNQSKAPIGSFDFAGFSLTKLRHLIKAQFKSRDLSVMVAVEVASKKITTNKLCFFGGRICFSDNSSSPVGIKGWRAEDKIRVTSLGLAIEKVRSRI
jgi:hypothetical protein